jgi:hypothetical protein
VTLKPGTRVGIDSGETFDWGGTKYDWFDVGEEDGALLEGVVFQVESYGGPHATMNGGGYDFYLRCVESGIKATLRTTFQRDERAAFEEAL